VESLTLCLGWIQISSLLLAPRRTIPPTAFPSRDLIVSFILHPWLTLDWSENAFIPQAWRGASTGFEYVAGVWDCINIAMTSLSGTQMVGVLADETGRQRIALPQAYRRIPSRLLTIYLLAVLILGITVDPTDPLLTLPTSPTSPLNYPGVSDGAPRNYPGGFVIMAERAGLSHLATFINVVMLVGIISAGIADVYFAVCPQILPLISRVVVLKP
jgi:amino acid permease